MPPITEASHSYCDDASGKRGLHAGRPGASGEDASTSIDFAKASPVLVSR